MRILLVNPPCGPRTIGLKNIAKIEPLGLELVGAGVSREHEVVLVDMEVAPGDLAATLREFTPDVVGVTSEIVHVETALAALREVVLTRTAVDAAGVSTASTPHLAAGATGEGMGVGS